MTLLKSETSLKYVQKKITKVFNPSKFNPDTIQYEYIKDKDFVFKGMNLKNSTIIANRTNIASIL